MLCCVGILANLIVAVSLVFFSTSPIAIPLFKRLLEDSRFEIRALICQPDRPVGRGQNLLAPEIKRLALDYHLPVFQPHKLRKDEGLLQQFKEGPPVDFLLTFAYGQILSLDWLNLARIAPLNVHPSLLPLYRGPSPLPAALLNGDSQTGISLMRMAEAMDAGPIAAQMEFPIQEGSTAGDLFEECALKAAEWIPEEILKLFEKPVFLAQDEAAATYCSLLTKEEAYTDFQIPAQLLLRRYRAYSPWPGLWTRFKGQRLKLFELALSQDFKLKPGEIFVEKGQCFIGTEENTVRVGAFQLEGKKQINAQAFLEGQRDFLGQILPS